MPFLWPACANAQLIVDGDAVREATDPLRDDRLIGVKDRPHPKLEPIGVNIGLISVRPTLGIDQRYRSNLLALEQQDRGDFVVQVTPALTISAKPFGMDAKLSGKFSMSRHARRKLENAEDYDLDFRIATPIRRGVSIGFLGSYGRLIESRTDNFASSDSLRPVRYYRQDAGLRITKSDGRFLATGQFAYRNLSYEDAIDRSDRSTVLPVSERSRAEYKISSQLEYSLSPDTKIFATGLVNRKNFTTARSQGKLIRDSNGFELGAGLRFKLTPVIEMAAVFAYLEQYYIQPLENVKGWSAEAQVKWLPTRLTTVRAMFSRNLEEGGLQAPGGIFLNRAELVIDHELLRNLILDVSLRYENFDFGGLDRRGRRSGLSFGAAYRPNRHLLLEAKYSRLDQNSDGRFRSRSFDQSRLSFSMTIAA